MYTLRLFKDVKEVNRMQIYLGDSYTVIGATEEEKEVGIKYRVFGNWDGITKDGISVYNNDHAYIMTAMGLTFETLNRPSAIPES